MKQMISGSNKSARNTFKPVTRLNLDLLGKLEGNVKIVDTVEEVRNNPPNIVVAECLRDFEFTQNKFRRQKCTKKVHYTMGLGVYSQLQYVEIRSRRDGKVKRVKVFKPGRYQFRNIYRPYSGQDLTDKSLLIWRTGGIGDLLFIQPLLKYIKDKYPTCKISFACAPQYQSMVETYKEVDELLSLPFPADVLFRTDYHGVFEGVIERTREAQTQNAYVLFSKALGLQIPEDQLVPDIEAKMDKVSEVKKILDEWGILGSRFVVLQPRASSPIRTPRPDIWKAIIEHVTDLGYNVVMTDSPHAAENIDQFIASLKDPSMVYNFAPKSLSLDMTIALSSLSELIVATDSALIHIGAALKKKVFGIYGPFPGHIRMSTYKNCDWIEAKDCPCAPCFLHGHTLCRYAVNGYSPCYDMINIGECYQKIDSLLMS